MAGFTSESVAAFRRNGWPTCVGINGRIGSEYAVSGDVAGIIASLFAFSQLSFHFEQAPFCSVLTNHFDFLRDYAAHHPHAALIYRAID